MDVARQALRRSPAPPTSSKEDRCDGRGSRHASALAGARRCLAAHEDGYLADEQHWVASVGRAVTATLRAAVSLAAEVASAAVVAVVATLAVVAAVSPAAVVAAVATLAVVAAVSPAAGAATVTAAIAGVPVAVLPPPRSAWTRTARAGAPK